MSVIPVGKVLVLHLLNICCGTLPWTPASLGTTADLNSDALNQSGQSRKNPNHSPFQSLTWLMRNFSFLVGTYYHPDVYGSRSTLWLLLYPAASTLLAVCIVVVNAHWCETGNVHFNPATNWFSVVCQDDALCYLSVHH